LNEGPGLFSDFLLADHSKMPPVRRGSGAPAARHSACNASIEQEAAMKEFGATLLRIMVGVIFVMHAYLVYFIVTPAGMVKFMGSTGFPAPGILVWYLLLGQLIGGIMMIIGLWTRWAALAMVPIIGGAVFMIHLKQGYFMTGRIVDAAAGRAMAVGFEFPLLLLVATIAVVLLGGGALATTKDK